MTTTNIAGVKPMGNVLVQGSLNGAVNHCRDYGVVCNLVRLKSFDDGLYELVKFKEKLHEVQ